MKRIALPLPATSALAVGAALLLGVVEFASLQRWRIKSWLGR